MSQLYPNRGFGGLAFFCYFAFSVCVIIVRSEVRVVYCIQGGAVQDVLSSVFMYNQTVWQAKVQCEKPLPKNRSFFIPGETKKFEDAKERLKGGADGIELQ